MSFCALLCSQACCVATNQIDVNPLWEWKATQAETLLGFSNVRMTFILLSKKLLLSFFLLWANFNVVYFMSSTEKKLSSNKQEIENALSSAASRICFHFILSSLTFFSPKIKWIPLCQGLCMKTTSSSQWISSSIHESSKLVKKNGLRHEIWLRFLKAMFSIFIQKRFNLFHSLLKRFEGKFNNVILQSS